MMPDATLLHGAGIVIARAEGRGDALCRRIRNAGGDALFAPVIAIRALPAVEPPAAVPDRVIFTSVPAVEHGLAICRGRIAGDTRIAAIGDATAAALRAAGVVVHAVPVQQESEGLLDHPDFGAVENDDTWLVKGRGGRTLLADTLAMRGAHVTPIEVYERVLPDVSMDPLLERWREGRVDIVVVSSPASLRNLHTLLDAEGRRHLGETQLVMPTERMLKLAHEIGIRPRPLIAHGASDDAQWAVLTQWWRNVSQDSR